MRRIFVTGIGTEVGKTFVSAILVEALKADYWKPVQCGDIDNPDSLWVNDFISNTKSEIHKERYLLSEPMSPHAAARIDGIEIECNDFKIPETNNHLIIEGAGGLMVPLNDKGETIMDLIPIVSDEVILVSKNYLGSINHTLMSIELIQKSGLNLTGIIFNGDANEETESVILNTTGICCLGKIPIAGSNLKEFIRKQAEELKI